MSEAVLYEKEVLVAVRGPIAMTSSQIVRLTSLEKLQKARSIYLVRSTARIHRVWCERG